MPVVGLRTVRAQELPDILAEPLLGEGRAEREVVAESSLSRIAQEREKPEMEVAGSRDPQRDLALHPDEIGGTVRLLGLLRERALECGGPQIGLSREDP